MSRDAAKVAKVVVEEITLHFGGDRVIQFLPYNSLTRIVLTYREKYLLM